MLCEHRVEAGELLLVVVGVHGGLRDQLIEFRVTQLPVHREHPTGGARSFTPSANYRPLRPGL
ncbi:hypothetical protein [Streptomyces chiangmaiensis]|uniref:Uncharacterized protein n=1 Tax=Streptomyces chiangmaiensis TaxID=766497 RepID=A0ABU7FX67_9ACTN|nr:hypothetical protein [Streptomyces chiangmaiensis]MED7828556.1 hypothetical protein [Streptomyces chiangmaiensis]